MQGNFFHSKHAPEGNAESMKNNLFQLRHPTDILASTIKLVVCQILYTFGLQSCHTCVLMFRPTNKYICVTINVDETLKFRG